jgi:hypothetical protein
MDEGTLPGGERLTRQAAPAKMVDEDDRRADFDQLSLTGSGIDIWERPDGPCYLYFLVIDSVLRFT